MNGDGPTFDTRNSKHKAREKHIPMSFAKKSHKVNDLDKIMKRKKEKQDHEEARYWKEY